MENIILAFGFSYLLGSVNPARLIAYAIARKNITELGDGNPGATNVFWNIGKIPGAFVFLFDAAKGFVPILVAYLMNLGSVLTPLIGSFAIIGHDFPIFNKFKGGTGISAIIGGLLFFVPKLVVLTIIFVASLVFLLYRLDYKWHFNLSPFESGEGIGFVIVIFFLLFSNNVDAKLYMLFSTSVVVARRFDAVLNLLKVKHKSSEI